MSSTDSTKLGVNNILSFNGHGGKISSDPDKTFELPDNVYVLVPFGIGVEGAKGLDGGRKTTDDSFKGLDVCYGFPSPENKDGNPQSFEDIIYGDPGKLKITFSNGSSNTDATWYLYKPGEQVPNVDYFPWKSGDPAAAAATCENVKNYDPFVSDLMKECLTGTTSNDLSKKVCALFVSDSTKTDTSKEKGSQSEVLTDKGGYRHLKLKICGDSTTKTTTLKELAENCHDLVNFSREFVKTKKTSGETYDGYDDDKIFPKSGSNDPIILLPFSCNSCGDGTNNIALSHTNGGDAGLTKSLSDIIGELSGGGGGSASPPPSTPSCNIENPGTANASIKNITLKCQENIFKLATKDSDELNILQKHLSVLRTDTQYATNKNLPPGSATIVDLNYYRKDFNYPAGRVKLGNQYKKNKKNEIVEEAVNSFNKEILFVIQAAPAGFGATNISNQSVTNSVYNCLYLANANGVKGIAFPIIGGSIFFSALGITKNQLYEFLLQGVADYFNDFESSKIEIVLFAGSKRVDENDDFNKTFNEFFSKNQIVKDKLKKIETGIFDAYYQYNNNDSNTTKITALVNAANTEITFTGVSGLALGFKNMLGGVGEKNKDTLHTLHSKETGLDEKIFTISNDITKEGEKIKKEFKAAVDAYIANPTAPPPSPSPPKPSPAPEPPKVLFADVFNELVGKLNDEGDKSVDFTTLRITSVKDDNFLYPTDDASVVKKSLNSADPAIDVMIKGFESAETGDDKNFYLGACRSIQAAYELERGDKMDDASAEAMRAKLLLNLRKNSLLLKVPARWDYVEMKMGEEPELTEEKVKAKYDILQQECAKLTKGSGHDDNYHTEKAYELAVELIPLDEKIESDKLQKKIELYDKYLPKSELTYKPINIKEGFTCEVTQGNNNCGRAALSNFFGDKNKFTKGFSDGTEQIMQNQINSLSPYDLASPRPDVINLGQICKLSQIFESFVDASSTEETTECRTDENYNYMVMSLALQICGFYKFDIPSIVKGDGNPTEKTKIDDKLMMCVNNKYVVGFIVLQNKSHWVNYKRVNIGSIDDSFYFINSGDCEEKQKTKTYERAELLKLIYSYHKTANKITKVIPIIRTTDDIDELEKSEKKRNLKFDTFKIANSSMSPKQLDHAFKSEYLPDACQEVTNIQIWEDNSRFEIKENKILIHSNQNNYKWKLFLKEVTSEIQKDKVFKTDEEKLKVMFYLSNFPSEIISDDLKQQILNSNESVKAMITQIFVDDTKDNINKIKIKTDSGSALKTDLEIVNKKIDYINLVSNSDGVNNFTPTFDAKERFYYNLNNNNKRYNKKVDEIKKGINYSSLIQILKKKVDDELFKQSSTESLGGGGFKPRHNPTTNHTASKSKHNSSFKASSSKTKGKSHNRSHTQRVK
jgi:O-acetyl-ADP-ribose deacetylase (regulator of RNase III)